MKYRAWTKDGSPAGVYEARTPEEAKQKAFDAIVGEIQAIKGEPLRLYEMEALRIVRVEELEP